MHRVVPHAADVPVRLERLHRAGGVGRAARELVLAGLGRPRGAPRLPRKTFARRLELRRSPFAVDAELDLRDRDAAARPRATLNFYGAPGNQSMPGIPVRNAGR